MSALHQVLVIQSSCMSAKAVFRSTLLHGVTPFTTYPSPLIENVAFARALPHFGGPEVQESRG